MPPTGNPNLSPAATVKALSIIHAGLIIGVVLFLAVVYSITPQKGFSISTDPLVIASIFLAVFGMAFSGKLFNIIISKISADSTLKQKIATYQTAYIARFALLEAPSLFSVVIYMLTGNLLVIAIVGVLLLFFISIRPTKSKVIGDLQLDYNEQAELDGSPNDHVL